MSKRYKARMVERMSTFAAAKEDDTKLIITTDSSLIMGTPLTSEDTLEDVPLFKQVLESFKSPNYNDVIDDDTYLKAVFLKDVQIQSTSASVTTNIPFLVVFVDDILGVSLGTLDSD